MKFIISIILIAFLSSLTEFILPWWTIAFVAFIVAMVIQLSPGKAFWAGFLGIAAFWLPDIVFKDFTNEHILSKRMAALFHLPNYFEFILVCVLLGSIVGGLGSLTGALLRKKEA